LLCRAARPRGNCRPHSPANDRRREPTGQSVGWERKSGTEGAGAENRHAPRGDCGRQGRDKVATCSRPAQRPSSWPFNWLPGRRATLS